MKSKAIELHDSTVSAIKQSDHFLEIIFQHICVHESSEIPGINSGISWVQKGRILLISPIINSNLPEFPAEVDSGNLKIDEKYFNNTLPFPLNSQGNVSLELFLSSKDNISFFAKKIKIFLEGNPLEIEVFPGVDIKQSAK